MRYNRSQTGFTLMEIVVATTIFATALTLILVLFTYTLKINRRVEALRQATQATRNFTEFLVRETRNSTIDYSAGTIDAHCTGTYPLNGNTATFLALVNRAGDRECFYYLDNGTGTNTGNLWLRKVPALGAATTEQVNPTNVSLDLAKFRFFVRPTTNPKTLNNGSYPGVQPMVAMIMNLTVRLNGADKPAVIPYQTVVSTDAYDIPHR